MSTDEAKKISSSPAIDFLNFQNECLWRNLDVDYEWVLIC